MNELDELGIGFIVIESVKLDRRVKIALFRS